MDSTRVDILQGSRESNSDHRLWDGLLRLTELLQRSAPLDVLLREGLEVAAEASGLRLGALGFVDEMRQVLVVCAVTPAAAAGRSVPFDVPLQETAFADVLRTGHPSCGGAGPDALWNGVDVESEVATPLMSGEEAIGLLALAGGERGSLVDGLLEWVRAAANVMASLALRARVDESLGNVEHRLAKILEVSKQGILSVDPEDTRVVSMSRTAERIYGRSLRELKERPGLFGEAVHPEDIEAFAKLFERQRQDGNAEGEFRIRRSDGTVVWIQACLWSFEQKNGPPKWDGIIRDITPRRRTAELLNMLLASIPCSVLLLDRGLRVVLANHHFLDKTGRTQGGTVGRLLRDVFPQEIIDALAMEATVLEVLDLGKPTSGVRLTYRAPGVPSRIYYSRTLPVGFSSTPELVMVLLEDITEQAHLGEEVRRAERHLAGVVEAACELVVSTDRDGNILSWNPAAERVSGFSAAAVLGRPFRTLCGPITGGDGLSFFGSTRIDECELMRKDGERVPVAWALSPMKDDLGEIVGVVAVGRDLTELRKLRMELLQRERLAALGVIASGIAHEIRNPLAVISSAAQFLADEALDPGDRLECLRRIERALARSGEIIENLLRFARPGHSVTLTRVDLVDIARDALGLVGHDMGVNHVRVHAELPTREVLVCGNAGLLLQVFVNLLLNALRAMSGGGVLLVSVDVERDEGVVTVADTGSGIPVEIMDRIFDPFFSTDPSGGTGLGLAVSLAVVKQHGGTIQVQSAEEAGSIFTVRLPLLEGSGPSATPC